VKPVHRHVRSGTPAIVPMWHSRLQQGIPIVNHGKNTMNRTRSNYFAPMFFLATWFAAFAWVMVRFA